MPQMKNDNYIPSLAIWEITLKCNLKCLHCGSSAGKARSNELTTKESLLLCKDLAELNLRGITLFGGEPFIRKDWDIIGKEIKDLGMKLSIVSNGFVNAKNIIQRLSRLHVDSVQISLDAASSKTHDFIRGCSGSFKKTIEFIHLSKKAGLPIGAVTTVSKMNFNELPAIRDFIIKEGIDWQIQEGIPIGRLSKKMILSPHQYYTLGLFIASTQKNYKSKDISISHPHNFGFHSEMIPSLNKNVNWNGCWAGKLVLGIQSDGNVKGCLALGDEFIEGNVREKSVIDIWENPNAFSYNRQTKKIELGENCKGCKYGKTCRGGCSTRSYVMTGVLYNDPFCLYQIEQMQLK